MCQSQRVPVGIYLDHRTANAERIPIRGKCPTEAQTDPHRLHRLSGISALRLAARCQKKGGGVIPVIQ